MQLLYQGTGISSVNYFRCVVNFLAAKNLYIWESI